VQYTAPYIRSGGGPGGWGCAIVEVPYQYYLHYGDKSVLEECYPNMMRYFDYLEYRSENNLVVTDKEGQWCLGDWCTPKSIVLPAPFVNNYFYIKSLEKCIEIAEIIGRTEDIPTFAERIERRKSAIMAAYFNKWDGNFLGGQQGANAFAVDIGLGDERTYKNMVEYYKKLGGYDTGIFGTEILIRLLFENGYADTALMLLSSEKKNSIFIE
jgi:alpha-L-rhamnosidase